MGKRNKRKMKQFLKKLRCIIYSTEADSGSVKELVGYLIYQRTSVVGKYFAPLYQDGVFTIYPLLPMARKALERFRLVSAEKGIAFKDEDFLIKLIWKRESGSRIEIPSLINEESLKRESGNDTV